MSAQPFTILCFASYEKGHEFLRQAKREGCRVFLLTSLSLKGKAHWPMESIDEIFYMPDVDNAWNRDHVIAAISHLARSNRIDRIVPLDEFDQEIAATVRAHLVLPGLDETTARRFRDKLYMRAAARAHDIPVPGFSGLFQDEAIAGFVGRVPAPWIMKPRFMAGAIGIRKILSPEELWAAVNGLGDQRSFYLLERYIEGNVCHVDSILWDGRIVFQCASAYGRPPLDVSHGGGVFTTSVIERGSDIESRLLALNKDVLSAMGLTRGVSHTEFIISHEDGEIYFLETAARVGGAHIADLVQAATGVNLWAEWARNEAASRERPYVAPLIRRDYAALIVSLARQEVPDTSAYNEPEIVWRMDEKHHVGLILASHDFHRIAQLLSSFVPRIDHDFGAVLPPASRPTH